MPNAQTVLKHSQNIERERRARRRLREELRQARAQADLAQVRNGVRLDAHDQALGVDTRGEALLATAQVTAAVSATLEERASPGASSSPPPLERRWFYELDAQANLEAEARDWIEEVLGSALPEFDLAEALKSGVVLCNVRATPHTPLPCKSPPRRSPPTHAPRFARSS